MVVFTCFHCGDSLQKPKVEKHINIECKKKYLAPKLCCVDCLKDFDRDTFVEHTKCVTEEERYSGKGFVPKASSNKNEKKQQSWIEIIQAVLKKPHLNEFQKKLLKALSSYSNVPRKLPKFRNFITTSLRQYKVHNNTIDEVFKLIDDEYKSVNAANFATKSNKQDDTVETQPSDKPELEKSDVQLGDKPTEEKKDKKYKLKDIENTSISEETPAETDMNETIAKGIKKNKKNKKENVENHNTTVSEKPSNGVNLDDSVAFEVVKKKKKKSKKKDDTETDNVDVADVVKIEPSEKILKRSVGDDIDQDIPMKDVSKKKSKKLKLQEVLENPPEDSEVNITNGSAEPAVSNITPSEETECTEKTDPLANLSKKERKELKKKLKYEAELKAIETEVVQPKESLADEQEIQTDELQKRGKKKKRKLDENIENDDVASKKTKLIENETNQEENVQASKFSWEEVIREILQKAEGNEISLKKLTKKAVAEYQSCHSDEKPYEEVLKRFNKKVNKLPFVKILKDKVKLSV